MAENTAIDWADDTANFWWGCEKVAPGCAHCYAKEVAERFAGDYWGGQKPRLYVPSTAALVRRLERKAAKEGRPRLVFVNSMADFFEDHGGAVVDRSGCRVRTCESCGKHGTEDGLSCSHCERQTPAHDTTLADLRADAGRLFDECPHLNFLLLTKRPENVRRMWTWSKVPGHVSQNEGDGWSHDYRRNVWLGFSASDQPTLDAGIGRLLACRDLAPVLFLSLEPLLGPLEFSDVTKRSDAVLQLGKRALDGIHWVICGGESGPGARPLHPDWARSLRDQCQAAGVPFFFKQWGEWFPSSLYDFDTRRPALGGRTEIYCGPQGQIVQTCSPFEHGCPCDVPHGYTSMVRAGKKAAGRLLDGIEWSEFPRPAV